MQGFLAFYFARKHVRAVSVCDIEINEPAHSTTDEIILLFPVKQIQRTSIFTTGKLIQLCCILYNYPKNVSTQVYTDCYFVFRICLTCLYLLGNKWRRLSHCNLKRKSKQVTKSVTFNLKHLYFQHSANFCAYGREFDPCSCQTFVPIIHNDDCHGLGVCDNPGENPNRAVEFEAFLIRRSDFLNQVIISYVVLYKGVRIIIII